MKKFLSLRLSAFILLSSVLFAQSAIAQTVIIPTTATWKYLDNGSNQGTAWRTGSFNDASWASGAAELGFGDNPVTTMVKSKIGYYLRKTVSIANTSLYTGFTLKLRRDDGIVVYVNNVEVYRNNMPSGTISYNTVASSTCSDDGKTVLLATLDVSRFVSGDNIIAVEVHNRTASSSDLTFELELIANGNSAPSCAIANVNYFTTRTVTATTAEVLWTALAGVSSYNVAYRIRNSGAAYSSPINTVSASAVLTGLVPSSNYEFVVQSVCSGGILSAFSSSGWFTTGIVSSTCITPDVNFFGTRNKLATSTEVYWGAISGASSYNVSYRIRNSGAAYSSPVSSAATFLVLTNLVPSSNYEFIVQSSCGGTSLSAFSSSGWFTTAASGGGTSTTTLVRGPYMTVATGNSINIQWRTGTASNNEVKFGTTTSLLSGIATNSTVSTEHSVALTGLLPNTKYYYSIGQVGSVLQGDVNNYFVTAPATGNSQALKFWVTGDFGNGSSGQTAVRNSFSSYTAGQTVNGWLWLGDNAYANGTDAEYQAYVFNVYPTIFKNLPVFPAPGNHDYAQSGYLSSAARGTNFPYFSIFDISSNSGTEKYYSTNYGNVHLIALDSYGSYNTVNSPMYNWLQSDLANNTQQWTIVYFHHAPYSKGSHDSDNSSEMVDMRRNIIPLLESYGVDLVLSGHSHSYERSNFIKNHTGLENTFSSSTYPSGNIIQSGGGPYTKTTRTGNGTVYVVCGVSGQSGGDTQSGYPHNAMYRSIINNYGSLVLDVNGGNLTCKFLTSTGAIGDEFSMQKTSSSPRSASEGSNLDNPEESRPLIYPNPSTGDLNISLNNIEDINLTVSVFSLTGSLVFTKDYPKLKGEDILIEKSQSRLSPGIYMVKIIGANVNVSKKLIIY